MELSFLYSPTLTSINTTGKNTAMTRWTFGGKKKKKKKIALNMPANLENSVWPQDWKRSVFIPILKKDNTKECSNYQTIALILHDSKVMLKIV